jgi:uncharacterized protein
MHGVILLHSELSIMSTTPHPPERLDVRKFAQEAAHISGSVLLSKLERTIKDISGRDADLASKTVQWTARGESVPVAGGVAQSWLHLHLQASVPMQCQRCLQAMDAQIDTLRHFRFVRDEAEANAQDDDAEEDLLVASKQFDLLELIEDELIMALPFAPTHEICPVAVKLASSAEEFEAALAEKPRAFAALGELKSVLKKVQP